MIWPKLVACFLLLFLIVSCDYAPWGYTKIGEITKSPSSFEGKQLKLKGVVKNVVKIPLTDVKIYELDDGTGEIIVVAQGSLPSLNGEISVKGKIESMAVLGTQAIGLRLIEEKRFE